MKKVDVNFIILPVLVILATIALLMAVINVSYLEELDNTDVLIDEKLKSSVSSITEIELLEIVELLSHKTMAGRGTTLLSKGGYELPSIFLARELRKCGFVPLGDALDAADPLNLGQKRSYFQEFKLWDKFVPSRNVLGLLEGIEKDQIIIIGAHYDHLGTNKAGDLYYGADDNASGTAAILEIAEAFSELTKKGDKPSKSILIAFWGAEEQGLLGSEHFVKHLPKEIKLENIISVVNLDMVGRNDSKELYVLGAPENEDFKKASPDLYEINKIVNEKYRLNFKFKHSAGDTFSRSDQYSFFEARPKGERIPVLFYFTGEHPDYHTPKDTFDKINYSKLSRVAKLAFLVCWAISNSPKRPVYID